MRFLQDEEADEAMWATNSLIKQIVEKDGFISYEKIPYMNELFQICGV